MIVAGLCNSYRAEILSGKHLESDTYKIALYTEEASLSPRDTKYVSTGETSGPGYKRGGQELGGFKVEVGVNGASATFDPVRWGNSTISAVGAMIYNARSGSAVAVFNFGGTRSSTNGDLTITFHDDLIAING